MTDPIRWMEALNGVPDAWKGVVAAVLTLFIVALIVKWMPRRGNGK